MYNSSLKNKDLRR